MAARSNTTVLSMKLIIDTKAQRVLFAEAGKDVVNLLFSLLAMPIATAVKLVGKDAMVGCVTNLYASVEELNDTVLEDMASALLFDTAALLHDKVANSPFDHLEGMVTCTVTDNLTVRPMSTISTFTMLNTLAVDIGALQEKTVQIGYSEGLAILKASLQSKTVLTDVFLSNDKKA